jgi:hypothetical protein
MHPRRTLPLHFEAVEERGVIVSARTARSPRHHQQADASRSEEY